MRASRFRGGRRSCAGAVGVGRRGRLRINHGSVTFPAADEIAFVLDKPIRPGSAVKEAFRVSILGDTGAWRHIGVSEIDLDETTNAVTLSLNRTLGGGLARVLVRGTGTTPLVGADGVPFAGAAGGPPGDAHNGHDFVHMTLRS